MLAEFFAVLRTGEVRRIPMRQDIQQRLSDQFEEAAQRLLAEHTELIPLSNAIYAPEYGQEAWLIDPFHPPAGITAALTNVRQLPDLTAAEVTSLSVRAVGARFHTPQSTWLAMQAIDRRKVIKPEGWSIILDGNVFRQLEEPGLQLGDDVHAVARGQQLIFDQLHWVKRVVDIADYYREATDADVEAFAEREDVALEDAEAFKRSADEWVRKRVALIADSEVLAQCTPRTIRERAAAYGIPVQVVRRGGSEKVLFPSAKRELKELLKFLGEDIYTGPLTDTQYVSTSKRKR